MPSYPLLTAGIINHTNFEDLLIIDSEGLGRRRAVEGREFLRILLYAVSSLNMRVDG
jgi:hypothetical protein